jgi:hypothetical protein
VIDTYNLLMCINRSFMWICARFCRIPMLLFFPSKPGRILQVRQNIASQNFCLGSRERFGAEQNQIPEFPHAYTNTRSPTLLNFCPVFSISVAGDPIIYDILALHCSMLLYKSVGDKV